MLRALYWKFHVRQGSIIAVIFRGSRNIWSSWRMTPDAPCIVLGISYDQSSESFFVARAIFGAVGG